MREVGFSGGARLALPLSRCCRAHRSASLAYKQSSLAISANNTGSSQLAPVATSPKITTSFGSISAARTANQSQVVVRLRAAGRFSRPVGIFDPDRGPLGGIRASGHGRTSGLGRPSSRTIRIYRVGYNALLGGGAMGLRVNELWSLASPSES
jgi:hypothetical protein